MSAPGRVAVVTGASGGIGRAVTRRLAADGLSVVAITRDARRLNGLGSSTPGVTALELDLLDGPDAANRLAAAVPVVDVLVCCAAAPLMRMPLLGGDLRADEAHWQEQLALNVAAPRRLVAWSAPLMRARGGGSLIFVSTVAARFPQAGLAVYSVSKAGLEALMRSAAFELGRYGIRSNCVAPGLVDTERTHHVVASSTGAEQRMTTPLGQLATPEDVGDVVAWLAGDSARSVTGQVITVDGGRNLGHYRADRA
jgi:NAD(P)-dependent dehydrogenase (short-subunit alcohol dehydrogenase family)